MVRGWSQEEVADRMRPYGYDWHQTTVGRIETAQRPLRLNELIDLGRLFGVALERLVWARTDMTLEQISAESNRIAAELEVADDQFTALLKEEDKAIKCLQDISAKRQAAEAKVSMLRAEWLAMQRAAHHRTRG